MIYNSFFAYNFVFPLRLFYHEAVPKAGKGDLHIKESVSGVSF